MFFHLKVSWLRWQKFLIYHHRMSWIKGEKSSWFIITRCHECNEINYDKITELVSLVWRKTFINQEHRVSWVYNTKRLSSQGVLVVMTGMNYLKSVSSKCEFMKRIGLKSICENNKAYFDCQALKDEIYLV